MECEPGTAQEPDIDSPRRCRLGAIVVLVGHILGGTAVEAAGPFADRVIDFTVGEGGGFNQQFLPDIVLGGPRGAGLERGSSHVVSLGRGGAITIEFVGSLIIDGPGPDFTVFENPFLPSAGMGAGSPFAEAGQVFVSATGVDFVGFPCALGDAANFFPGCAGVFPVLANADDPLAPLPTVPTTVPISMAPPASSSPLRMWRWCRCS